MAILSIAEKNTCLRKFYLSHINQKLEVRLIGIRSASNLDSILAGGQDRSSKVRREVAKRLKEWVNYPLASDLLLTMLNDQDYLVRWFSALSLSCGDVARIRPTIEKLLSSTDLESWLLASVIKRSVVIPAVKPLLIKGLDGPEGIKNLALVMLARAGEMGLVGKYINDPSPAIRETVQALFAPSPRKADRITFSSHPEINQAVLLAEAIGDGMGAPVEFSSLQEIKQIGYVNGFLQDPFRPLAPGDYTDDTDMAVMVAQSIIRAGKVDPFDAAGVFAAFGLKLDLGLVRNVGYSNSTLTSYRRLYAGLNWRLAANDSNGCGPATAVVPLGLAIEDLDQLRRDVAKVTLITKSGKDALAGALAVAYLIHQGRHKALASSPAKILEDTASFVKNESEAMAAEILGLASLLTLSAEEGLNRIPHHADGKKVKVGMKSIGVVPSAIYSFVKSPEDFRQTIISAVNTEGDSDSIAALAGAISAAYNGPSGIPAEWTNGLVEHQFLADLGHKLPSL